MDEPSALREVRSKVSLSDRHMKVFFDFGNRQLFTLVSPRNRRIFVFHAGCFACRYTPCWLTTKKPSEVPYLSEAKSQDNGSKTILQWCQEGEKRYLQCTHDCIENGHQR